MPLNAASFTAPAKESRQTVISSSGICSVNWLVLCARISYLVHQLGQLDLFHAWGGNRCRGLIPLEISHASLCVLQIAYIKFARHVPASLPPEAHEPRTNTNGSRVHAMRPRYGRMRTYADITGLPMRCMASNQGLICARRRLSSFLVLDEGTLFFTSSD